MKGGNIKISSNTRQSRAGDLRGQSVIEDAHNFYLDMNALEYLNALKKKIDAEFAKRKAEFFKWGNIIIKRSLKKILVM